MRLYEFWRDDNSIDFDQFRKIRKLLGVTKFDAPNIDFTVMNGALGKCIWCKTDLSVRIDINKQLLRLKDNTVINRSIAHELCHEAEYRLFWLPKLAKLASQFAQTKDTKDFDVELAKNTLKDFYQEMDNTDHGPQWQKYVDMVNVVYG